MNPAESPSQFSLRIREGFPIVVLKGDVDISTADQFRNFLTEHIPENASFVLFEFSGVEYFDSTALGILLAYPKPPRRKLIFAPGRAVLRFFQSISFKNPLLFAADEDSAIKLARSNEMKAQEDQVFE
ncbi:MAG: STAS domain-containing protein [Leptospirales bacterium]|nr:STAS domain-containing protein [Leptospirales bacterium]